MTVLLTLSIRANLTSLTSRGAEAPSSRIGARGFSEFSGNRARRFDKTPFMCYCVVIELRKRLNQ